MLRTTLLFAFGIGLALALWTSPTTAQDSRVQKITDGVWFRLGDLAEGHCNNVIIDLGDGLLVVDANFPSGAQAAMEDIKKLSSKPVKYVFDTHHHGDHAYANALWTRGGATTLAYGGVLGEIQRYEPDRWRQAMRDREDVAAVGDGTLEPPDEVFWRSPWVIEGTERSVELHHFGWAHTRGDGFVFLPEEKILCTGDAIVNGAFNYTGDGNTGNWPDVIRRAQALGAEKVLPGHGPAGGPEIAAGQRAFLEEINEKVGAAFRANRPLEELVAVEDGRGVSTTIELSGDVGNWVGDGFAEQVRVRYQELAEGRPHGDILAAQ